MDDVLQAGLVSPCWRGPPRLTHVPCPAQGASPPAEGILLTRRWPDASFSRCRLLAPPPAAAKSPGPPAGQGDVKGAMAGCDWQCGDRVVLPRQLQARTCGPAWRQTTVAHVGPADHGGDGRTGPANVTAPVAGPLGEARRPKRGGLAGAAWSAGEYRGMPAGGSAPVVMVPARRPAGTGKGESRTDGTAGLVPWVCTAEPCGARVSPSAQPLYSCTAACPQPALTGHATLAPAGQRHIHTHGTLMRLLLLLLLRTLGHGARRPTIVVPSLRSTQPRLVSTVSTVRAGCRRWST